MKLALDKKHGNRIELIAAGMSSSFANMLRRYAMSRIPVLAIDKVTFYENTSAFWDEYISHRLGLMPITTPDQTPESAEITFSLDAQGPKLVYSSELISSDKDISVAKGTIPVVTLGPEQHLRLECKAVIGTARRHAKFQAGLVSYGDSPNGLRVIAESFYHMEPYEVLTRTCEIIEADIEGIESALGKKSEKKEKPAKKEKKAEKKEKKPKAKKEEKAEEKSEKKEE